MTDRHQNLDFDQIDTISPNMRYMEVRRDSRGGSDIVKIVQNMKQVSTSIDLVNNVFPSV